jgi:hypothetical protein
MPVPGCPRGRFPRRSTFNKAKAQYIVITFAFYTTGFRNKSSTAVHTAVGLIVL